MSHIKKLAILGIRSFGPDEQKVIEFNTPLTLILGQNGCGKTTIIESLKYVTTGDMPPGTGTGASFIHDPKMARETSVKGQVKLQFCNVQGRLMTAMRSSEATQKPKKVEIKTLTTTIAMRDADGNINTIDGKCNDMLASMCAYLGVSKAILNYVIFCHQEESNWPLDEGKKVKEKFDAIFSATSYIKALEAIKKKRKDMMLQIKNLKSHLELLAQLKEEVRRKERDLRSAEEDKKSATEETKEIQEEMTPLLRRLREIAKVEDQLTTIRGELNGKKHHLNSVRQIQEELRSSLSEKFTCSDRDLNNMINDFRKNLEEAEQHDRKLSNEIRQVEEAVQVKQQESAQAQRRQGELEAAHTTYTRHITHRNNTLTTIVHEFKLTEFSDLVEFDDAESESVMRGLMQRAQQLRTDITNRKKEFELSEAQVQSQIDHLRSQEAALQYKIETKGTELKEVNQKTRQLKQRLMKSESELSHTNTETIQEEATQLEAKMQAQETQLNAHTVSEEIEEEKRRRSELQCSVDEAKRVVSRMNRQAEDRSQLDIHSREKKELITKIEYLKRKHAEELEHLLDEVPQDNIKNKLDTCMQNLRKCITETSNKLTTLNRRKTQLDTTINNHKLQADRKEREINDLQNKLSSICGTADLDTSLAKAKKSKEDLTREKADLASSIAVLKRFQEKLRQKDCCPLCHRDFITKEEVALLIEELEEKVTRFPEKMKGLKHKLEEQEKVHEQMIQLQPQRDQAILAQTELQKIRSQMEEEVAELQRVNEEINNQSELLEMTQGDEDTARSIQADVITLETHMKRVRQLDVLIEDLQQTLGQADVGLSMDEAVSNQNELEERYRQTQNRLEELQERLREHQDKMQRYRNRKLELARQELELKNKMQEVDNMKKEKSELEGRTKQLQEEIELAQAEVTPFKYKIQDKTKEKNQITKDKENYIDDENKKVSVIVDKHRSVESTHTSIKTYQSEGGETHLTDIRLKIAALQDKMTALHNQKQNRLDEKRNLEREITNQRERKRNLDDEKKIRDKEREAEATQREIDELEEKIGGFSVETLTEEKIQVNNKAVNLQTKKSKLEGRLQELEKTIVCLTGDLSRKEMKEASHKHKLKLVELKCSEMAVSDANVYHKVLDTAIMAFHRQKMKILNNIVRELWRQTYKGNDIDYIEIKTKDAEAKGADKRQTYDYRVIMVKNDTEMDMRGRCSAGQKVLASLLIRMALAETFSSQCGILALDEPTTNLDRENIDALATALTEIVKSRVNRANSQLIVITHDSSFLEKLASSSLIDEYIEVKRNEMGLSNIVKCKTKESSRL